MDTDATTSDREPDLPTDFAEQAAAVTGLDEPPATLEEWWAAVAEQYSADDITVGFAALYSKSPTRHEVHVNGRVRYTFCAMDALKAATMEDQASVTVRSVDPVSATPVTITIADDDVAVSPEGAFVSFGMDLDPADVEAVGSLAAWSVQDDTDEIRDSVCQYTNAFESEETYHQWDEATDSISAPLAPEDLVPLLREVPAEGTRS